MIDAVYSASGPFTCSSCHAWKTDPQLIGRLTGLRPDHPPEVERVDVLLCEDCLITLEREAKAALARYLSSELADINAETIKALGSAGGTN